MQQALLKFSNGDRLDDQELDMLLELFTNLEKGLSVLGKEHHFSWLDCYHKKERLLGFKKFREDKKTNWPLEGRDDFQKYVKNKN